MNSLYGSTMIYITTHVLYEVFARISSLESIIMHSSGVEKHSEHLIFTYCSLHCAINHF